MPGPTTLPARGTSAWAARGRGALRLAAGYALAGAGATAVAPFLHAWAWLAWWFAGASAVLAYAYAVNQPAVFGKRPDGRLAPLSVIVLLPYLLFAWGFFRLKLAWLRGAPAYHRVADGLYLGRRPYPAELPEDCTLVVDLTAEFPAHPELVAARPYRCLPTLNRHVPSESEFCTLLDELRRWDGPLYLHCGAGRGRSAMVAAALLVLRGSARDAADAEDQLRRVRRSVRLHPAQRALVDRCAAALRPGAARQIPAPSARSPYTWSARPAPTTRTRR